MHTTNRVPMPLEAYRTDLKDRTFSPILKFKMQDGTFSAMRERLALNWLLQEQSEGALLHQLKKFTLCMDLAPTLSHPFSPWSTSAFSVLDKEKRDLVRMLRKNEKLVDVVIQSIFWWFGTNVGRENLVSLAKVLDDNELLKDLFNHWDERHVFCPNCNHDTKKVFKEVSKDAQFTCTGCSIDFYRDGTKTGTHHGGTPFGRVSSLR